MASATLTGGPRRFTLAGLQFERGQPRPVPDSAVAVLLVHPWFEVEGVAEPAPEVTEPAASPKKRGRPKKVMKDAADEQ